MNDEDLLAGVVEREKAVGRSGLTTPERQVYDVLFLEFELDMGGFRGYFFNSHSDNFSDTLEALRQIGAKEILAIVAEAGAVVGLPADIEIRRTALEELEQGDQELLDTLYSRYCDTSPSDLHAQLAAHLRES